MMAKNKRRRERREFSLNYTSGFTFPAFSTQFLQHD